jgi:hypothetical protein
MPDGTGSPRKLITESGGATLLAAIAKIAIWC